MTRTSAREPRARQLLAAVVCVAYSGCSFATVQRSRPPEAIQDPRVLDDCSASREAPVADTVFAAAGLVAGYALMIAALAKNADCIQTSTNRCESGNPLPGLGVMAAGGVFAGSAIYGYVTTAQCRRRVVVGQRCGNGDLMSCQRLKPDWMPPPGWRPRGAVLEPMPASAPPAPTPQAGPQDPSSAGTPAAPSPR